MSLHLYLSSSESAAPVDGSLPTTNLRLLCAYENGSVALWKYTRKDKLKSVEGQGWEMIWNPKLHAESSMQLIIGSPN
jgi:ASTRA-associated protein 1